MEKGPEQECFTCVSDLASDVLISSAAVDYFLAVIWWIALAFGCMQACSVSAASPLIPAMSQQFGRPPA
jgi:hypothetical protein